MWADSFGIELEHRDREREIRWREIYFIEIKDLQSQGGPDQVAYQAALEGNRARAEYLRERFSYWVKGDTIASGAIKGFHFGYVEYLYCVGVVDLDFIAACVIENCLSTREKILKFLSSILSDTFREKLVDAIKKVAKKNKRKELNAAIEKVDDENKRKELAAAMENGVAKHGEEHDLTRFIPHAKVLIRLMSRRKISFKEALVLPIPEAPELALLLPETQHLILHEPATSARKGEEIVSSVCIANILDYLVPLENAAKSTQLVAEKLVKTRAYLLELKKELTQKSEWHTFFRGKIKDPVGSAKKILEVIESAEQEKITWFEAKLEVEDYLIEGLEPKWNRSNNTCQFYLELASLNGENIKRANFKYKSKLDLMKKEILAKKQWHAFFRGRVKVPLGSAREILRLIDEAEEGKMTYLDAYVTVKGILREGSRDKWVRTDDTRLFYSKLRGFMPS